MSSFIFIRGCALSPSCPSPHLTCKMDMSWPCACSLDWLLEETTLATSASSSSLSTASSTAAIAPRAERSGGRDAALAVEYGIPGARNGPQPRPARRWPPVAHMVGRRERRVGESESESIGDGRQSAFTWPRKSRSLPTDRLPGAPEETLHPLGMGVGGGWEILVTSSSSRWDVRRAHATASSSRLTQSAEQPGFRGWAMTTITNPIRSTVRDGRVGEIYQCFLGDPPM